MRLATTALIGIAATLAAGCGERGAGRPAAVSEGGGTAGGDAAGDTAEADGGSEGTAPERGDTASAADSADTAGPTSEQVFEVLVDVSVPVRADLSCYTPGGTCLRLRPYEECVQSRDVVGQVVDASSGEPLPGAEVQLYWGDALEDQPDAAMTADDRGEVSGGSAPTCLPLLWRTVRADGGEHLLFHQLFPLPDDPEQPSVEGLFPALGSGELAALLAQAGLEADPAAGVILGEVRDCAGQPLRNVQVVASRRDGGYPAEQIPFYFSGDTPDPARSVSDEGGRWGVAGLAPGQYYVEIWGLVGDYGEVLNLSYSEIDVVAGGVSEIALQSGIAGAVYPDVCLDPCE